MTSIAGGTATVRLDNGKLRNFPVADLTPAGPGPTDSEKALDDVAASLDPTPTSAPAAAKALAPTKAVEVEYKSTPVAPAQHRVPMEFKETPVSQVPAYAADSRYFFQQKVDGIRGQLVLRPGEKPWFRSKSGDKLQSSTAAKISGPLLAKLGAGLPPGSPEVTVDGEMLDGKWYVFDMTVEGVDLPWDKRMNMAEDWVTSMRDQGVPGVTSLPTARTKEEKEALFAAVRDNGGEGVMIKRRDAKYKWGQRTEEILKAKITTTVDAVVMERNREGKDNAIVGVYKGGKLVEVASLTTIGKEKVTPIKVGDVVEVEYLWAHPGTGKLTQPRFKKLRPDKNALLVTDSQFRYVNKKVLDVPNVDESVETSTSVGTDIKPKSFDADVDAMPYAVSPVPDITMLNYEDLKAKGLQGVVSTQQLRMKMIDKGMEGNPAFRARVKSEADQLKAMAVGPTFVAVPMERLDNILQDGRLRTMFEGAVSTGGGNETGTKNQPGYTSARREFENVIAGIGGGKAIKPADRPVYGYVGPSAGRSGQNRDGSPSYVDGYGEIHLELKPQTGGRTTVTFGDSLNGALLPRKVADLDKLSDRELLQSSIPGQLYWAAQGDPQKDDDGTATVQYVEAQIHGGVKMTDVVRIHVDGNTLPLKYARENLAKVQAEWDAADPATRSQMTVSPQGYKSSPVDKRLESAKKRLEEMEQVLVKRLAFVENLKEQGYDAVIISPDDAPVV